MSFGASGVVGLGWDLTLCCKTDVGCTCTFVLQGELPNGPTSCDQVSAFESQNWPIQECLGKLMKRLAIRTKRKGVVVQSEGITTKWKS